MLRTDGVALLTEESGFLSDAEWREVDRLATCELMPYETVYIGDAGEKNQVDVGRIKTDVDRPRVVNDAVSNQILKVLAAPERMAFFQNLLDIPKLYLRRAQINRMQVNSFIGLHIDKDSNPDYEVAIVLQLGQAFEGGDFIVHLPDGMRKVVKPAYRSISITRCELPHEVATVTGGERLSLVFFLSRHADANRRLQLEAAAGNAQMA